MTDYIDFIDENGNYWTKTNRFREARETIAAQAAVIEKLREVLEELVDLVQDIRAGEYKPDSFTCQPALAVLALPTDSTQILDEVRKQALSDTENQPNQYGVEFGMHGEKMMFKIGCQQFTLDYSPDEQDEFECMKKALIHAFSTFTPDVKIDEVRRAERERCAELCEKSDRYRGDYFAAKIRAME